MLIMGSGAVVPHLFSMANVVCSTSSQFIFFFVSSAASTTRKSLYYSAAIVTLESLDLISIESMYA